MALLSVVLLTGCTGQDQLTGDDLLTTGSTDENSNMVGDPVSGTYIGTQTIELGDPPTEATHIYVELTCVSAGTIVLQDGDEVACTDPGKGTTRAFSSLPLSPGQDSIEIATGAPDVRYEAKAVYESGASVR